MKTFLYDVPQKFDPKKIEQALDVCADRLLPTLKHNLKVHVRFTKIPKALGLCLWLDRNYRPRDFSIKIRPAMTKEKTLLVLCHEMVHVAQYASNRLRDLEGGVIRWDKKDYELNSFDYLHEPWEVEARGLELALYNDYNVKSKYYAEEIL